MYLVVPLNAVMQSTLCFHMSKRWSVSKFLNTFFDHVLFSMDMRSVLFLRSSDVNKTGSAFQECTLSLDSLNANRLCFVAHRAQWRLMSWLPLVSGCCFAGCGQRRMLMAEWCRCRADSSLGRNHGKRPFKEDPHLVRRFRSRIE